MGYLCQVIRTQKIQNKDMAKQIVQHASLTLFSKRCLSNAEEIKTVSQQKTTAV